MPTTNLLAACLLVGRVWTTQLDSSFRNRAAQPADPPPLSCSPSGGKAGVRCNMNGFVSFAGNETQGYDFCGDNQNTTQITPDFNSCRDLCKGRSQSNQRADAAPGSCASFGYNTATGLCSFSCYNLGQQNFTADPRSKTVWSHELCYSCKPRTCPSPGGVNLLDNGGFENNDMLIGPWSYFGIQYPAPTVVSPGHNSNQAVKFEYDGSPSTTYMLQDFFTCRRQLYVLSMDYYISTEPPPSAQVLPQLIFSVNYEFALDQRVDLHLATVANAWQSTRLYFYGATYTGTQQNYDVKPLLATAEIGLSPHTGEGGYALVDNISVLPTSVSPKPGAISLLKNGGFESGSLKPWNYTTVFNRPDSNYRRPDFVGIVAPGISSGHALQIRKNDTARFEGDDQYDAIVGKLTQDFDAVPGTAYIVRAQYTGTKLDDPHNYSYVSLGHDFQLLGYPEASRSRKAESTTYFDAFPNEYHEHDFPTNGPVALEYVFVATHEYMRFQFDLSFSVGGISVNVTLDNFSIIEVA